MEEVRLPLSGAVIQTFNFNGWPSVFNTVPAAAFANAPAQASVGVGMSTNSAVELELLAKWSYGRQLGVIGDALGFC